MWVRVAITFLLLLLPTALHAQSEKRIALLIGNQGYGSEIGRLANPHNDVALLEKTLKALGFEVRTVRDAGLAGLHQAVNAYARRVQAAGPNAIGFLYYSGHGAADGGTNYLIPIDVKTTETGELWDQSLRLTEITRKLKAEAGNATHFVVFDACRNTLKLTNAGSRALVQSKGFVPVAQETGMLIAYATAEGELASDVGAGAGPYAKTLAEEIIKPGVEAVAMFRVVQRRVRMAIKQEPYLGFNAMGDVYLAGAASAQATASLSEAAEAWDRTKDTTSISALEAFIGRFGDSYYGDLAKVRLSELKQAEAAARKKADEEARAKAEAERQRLALLQREEEARKRAEAEEARRKAENQTERNDCTTSNDPERKIRDCTALIARDQSNALAFGNRGYAYANKGDYDRAITDYDKAIELDPKYVNTYNNRGLVYFDMKDYDRAFADYNKAIELNPKYVHAYNNRGRVYADDKKDYDRAITDYNRAMELDPKYVHAYNNRGRVYAYNKKDYDRAIADYDKAIELDPKYVRAYNNRGSAYENKKDTDRAIADYRKALALDPNNKIASDGLKRLEDLRKLTSPPSEREQPTTVGGILQCESNSDRPACELDTSCAWVDNGRRCQRKSGSLATAMLESSPASKPTPEGSCAGVEALVGNEKRCLKPGDSFKDCPDCPEMVVVPAGSFMMGSNVGLYNNPVHKVSIIKPYAVAKFEVTFAEWDACVAAGSCMHRPDDKDWGRGKQPVINVSWDDVTKEYLPWLLRQTGRTYRLLSEAEWEYAARAGTKTEFSTGETIESNHQANYAPTSEGTYYRQRPVEVGSFPPNAFGLHEMHGNVSEWVEDCRHANYRGAPTDGSVWSSACKTGAARVLRGGSWNTIQDFLRSATRNSTLPGSRYDSIGFRVARTLTP